MKKDKITAREQAGVEAIHFLLKFTHVTEPDDTSLANWRAMSPMQQENILATYGFLLQAMEAMKCTMMLSSANPYWEKGTRIPVEVVSFAVVKGVRILTVRDDSQNGYMIHDHENTARWMPGEHGVITYDGSRFVFSQPKKGLIP